MHQHHSDSLRKLQNQASGQSSSAMQVQEYHLAHKVLYNRGNTHNSTRLKCTWTDGTSKEVQHAGQTPILKWAASMMLRYLQRAWPVCKIIPHWAETRCQPSNTATQAYAISQAWKAARHLKPPGGTGCNSQGRSSYWLGKQLGCHWKEKWQNTDMSKPKTTQTSYPTPALHDAYSSWCRGQLSGKSLHCDRHERWVLTH